MSDVFIFTGSNITPTPLTRSDDDIRAIKNLLREHNIIPEGIAVAITWITHVDGVRSSALALRPETEEKLTEFLDKLDALAENHPVMEAIRKMGGLPFSSNVTGPIRPLGVPKIHDNQKYGCFHRLELAT